MSEHCNQATTEMHERSAHEQMNVVTVRILSRLHMRKKALLPMIAIRRRCLNECRVKDGNRCDDSSLARSWRHGEGNWRRS
jgi:hypothetical protein